MVALRPVPRSLTPFYACGPCSSALTPPRLHYSLFPPAPFGFVVLPLPPNVKMNPEKARKYVTIDGNRISCGALDFHFSRYKKNTRLPVHLYTCSNAHSRKPDILYEIAAAGGSSVAGRGPPDVRQNNLPRVHHLCYINVLFVHAARPV